MGETHHDMTYKKREEKRGKEERREEGREEQRKKTQSKRKMGLWGLCSYNTIDHRLGHPLCTPGN